MNRKFWTVLLIAFCLLGAAYPYPTRAALLTVPPLNDDAIGATIISSVAFTENLLTTASFTETNSLILHAGEENLSTAVIDTVHGFAYFGTGYCGCPSPGVIVKVRLLDFVRVDALVLNPSENDLASAVIDTVNGYAYFGTRTVPGKVIKVRLSDFTRVSALTLNAGEDRLTSAVIDSANGFAYFGTGYCGCSSPGIVVKVRLSDFTRVGALALNADETYLGSAVIDTANGFVYFGTGRNDYPAYVIKVRLSDFTRVGALPLSVEESGLLSAVIDINNGFAYFGTYTYPTGHIIKIRLADLTRESGVTLYTSGGEYYLHAAVIDLINGFAYFGGGIGGRIVKLRLSDFARVVSIPVENGVQTAVIDNASGSAYFGTGASPGIVIKVDTTIHDLLLTQFANPTAAAGDVLTYTLRIENDGPYSATGLVLTDTLPVSVTFLAATFGSSTCNLAGAVLSCDLGSLPAGETMPGTIQVTVEAATLRGVITNTASVSADEPRYNLPISTSLKTLISPLRTYLPLVAR